MAASVRSPCNEEYLPAISGRWQVGGAGTMARATAASVGGEPHLLSRYGCEAALAVLHCDRSSRTPPRNPPSPAAQDNRTEILFPEISLTGSRSISTCAAQMAEGRGPYLNRAFKYRRPRSTRGQFGTRKKEPPQCVAGLPVERKRPRTPFKKKKKRPRTGTAASWKLLGLLAAAPPPA
jgi:hypothetical protein